MTQYKTNHYHKSENSHEHNKQCGKVIKQYNVPETEVFVLWVKYMPHEHEFWTETSNFKHLQWIQQLQAPNFKAKMKRADNALVQMAPYIIRNFIV
jgi:hypothetical protein